jgi:uncharacterized YceG family protein
VDVPTPTDPFGFDDPEARAREERRLERERRRRERQQRRQEGGASAGGLKGVGRKRRTSGDGVPAAAENATDGSRPIERAQPPGREPASTPPTRVQRARAGMAGVRRRLPRRPSPDAVRRRRIAAIAALLVVALILWFILALLQPLGGDGEGKAVVKIPKGATAGEVGDILERKGVISGGPPFVSGSTLFRLRLSMSGKSDDIPSGTYTLATGMSYGAAIDELTASPSERGTTVVIPEGYTREQIARIVKDAGLEGNYMRASKSSKSINLKRYGAGSAKSLEGFLYPATYELEPGSHVDDLVEQQLRAFQQDFREVNMKYASSKNLGPYDVLTIASMIDREVQVPRERKLVGEVIYNRLETGEPLAIDATIRYATGNYDEQLSQSELSTDSPYNTRLVAGLPPTPIGNPGIEAIEAAADPGRGGNRFFVVKPGTCGEHFFTESEREFNDAADRYQRALEREGGSPTEC